MTVVHNTQCYTYQTGRKIRGKWLPGIVTRITYSLSHEEQYQVAIFPRY